MKIWHDETEKVELKGVKTDDENIFKGLVVALKDTNVAELVIAWNKNYEIRDSTVQNLVKTINATIVNIGMG